MTVEFVTCTLVCLREAKSVCLEQVQKRLVVREHEVVPFSIFRSAVYLCLISIGTSDATLKLFLDRKKLCQAFTVEGKM